MKNILDIQTLVSCIGFSRQVRERPHVEYGCLKGATVKLKGHVTYGEEKLVHGTTCGIFAYSSYIS